MQRKRLMTGHWKSSPKILLRLYQQGRKREIAGKHPVQKGHCHLGATKVEMTPPQWEVYDTAKKLKIALNRSQANERVQREKIKILEIQGYDSALKNPSSLVK